MQVMEEMIKKGVNDTKRHYRGDLKNSSRTHPPTKGHTLQKRKEEERSQEHNRHVTYGL